MHDDTINSLYYLPGVTNVSILILLSLDPGQDKDHTGMEIGGGGGIDVDDVTNLLFSCGWLPDIAKLEEEDDASLFDEGVVNAFVVQMQSDMVRRMVVNIM